MYPLIGSLGTPELLLILAVVVLLFGASKLPDLARGSGRALRIFKAETKGLMDDDDETATPKAVVTPEQAQLDAAAAEAAHAKKLAEAQALLDAEKLRTNDTPA